MSNVFGDLVRLVGEDAALLFIETFGGRRVFIPKRAATRALISRVIGGTAAKALSAEFGGMQLRVPLAKQWRMKVYRQQGMSHSDIAKAIGATENSVQQALRRMYIGARGAPPVGKSIAERANAT